MLNALINPQKKEKALCAVPSYGPQPLPKLTAFPKSGVGPGSTVGVQDVWLPARGREIARPNRTCWPADLCPGVCEVWEMSVRSGQYKTISPWVQEADCGTTHGQWGLPRLSQNRAEL